MRYFVEGQPSVEDVTLYDGEGSSRTAIDGTGLTVTLRLLDRNLGLVNVAGEVAWQTQASGIVRYTPSVHDMKAERSPYQATFIVTDGSGNTQEYPKKKADVWIVRK